ncbi:MAG: hypothetical protein LBM21_00860, partial [Coriobacteriales bacterium]|nr:hypothetical protein [Coriobacteriales bacterium]
MDINREQGTGGRSDGRQNGVAFYLDSADAARKSGNARLAIHLYCAAFEANSNQGTPPSAQVIEGLRKAWNLAIEKGDRSTAEAILDSLIPYNSEKQNEESLSRLQGLAVQQLEDAGLGEDTLADMVSVFRDNFEDIAGLLDGTDYYDADADDDDDE